MCQATNEGKALDVIEIDAASNTGVDDIRSLRERVNYAPNQARYKVYIIDEVHMLSTSASNALLKTLEEPPPYVIFVLATTEAHKVLPTLQSRCQRFDFRRLSRADIVSKLTNICSAEGIQIEPEALRLIAKSATGSLRDAENLLQQLSTYYGSEIGLHQVQAILGITGDWRAKEVAKHIIDNDVSAGIVTINSVNNDGLDLRQFNRELMEYLRGLLLVKAGADESTGFTADEIAELKDLAARASLPHILKAIKLFGQLELGFENYSTLPLELALVDCVLAPEKELEISAEPTHTKLHRPTKEATPPTTPPRPEPPETEPEPTDALPPAAPGAEPEPIDALPPAVPEAEPEPVDALPPAAPEAAAIQPSEPGGEIERIRLNWRQIIEQAPESTKRTPAIAILRSAGVMPVATEGDTVVLAFRYSYHKEQIEKLENKLVAQEILGHFLGRACNIRCIYEPEDNHLLRAALKMGAQIIDTEEK
jgi:DNA polymerase-3 subunit gamma/tau